MKDWWNKKSIYKTRKNEIMSKDKKIKIACACCGREFFKEEMLPMEKKEPVYNKDRTIAGYMFITIYFCKRCSQSIGKGN